VTTTPVAEPAARDQSPASRFQSRHVLAIAGCYFVASFAALGLPPYLTEILPELGDSTARWAGLLYVVPTVFSAVGGPLWGRLADRFGHKPLLLRAQLGLSAAFVLAGLADSLALFALALALQGVLGGTYAASTGILGAALDGTAMSRALTLMQVAARASLVAAPILVGALAPWFPPHRQYLLLAALPLAAALMLAVLPAPPRVRPHRRHADAVRATDDAAHPWSLYLLEFAFVFVTVISFPYLIALAERTAPGISPGLSGLLFAVPHLLFLLAAVPLHDTLARRPDASVGAGFGLVALGLAGHVTADSLTDLVVARICLGAGLTLGLVGLAAIAAATARGRSPGRMFGWVELFSKAGAVASGVVATATFAWMGPAGPMVAGSAVAAACAVALTALTVLRRPTRSHRLSDPSRHYQEPCMTNTSVTTSVSLPTADEAVAHTLLNCLLREISGPEHQTAVVEGALVLRLPRQGALLRVALRRTSLLGAHRFRGPVEVRRDDDWRPLGWESLAGLVEGELSLRTGLANDEFLDQVRSTHHGVSSALTAERPPTGSEFRDSEQSLLFGHRFHPTPKARSGANADWTTFAPEAGAAFGLRQLAVRDELVVEESADPDGLAVVDRRRSANVPRGYTFLPAHPWQWELMRHRPEIQQALEEGDLLDLGETADQVWPTSSVRTVCDDHGFLKFSLHVRITNCLRKNANYELSGAVALTRRLDPVAADLAARFAGTVLLREPAYRSVALPDSIDALEGLAVIVREGLDRALPGTRVLLAAAVADEYPTSSAQVSRLLADPGPEQVTTWWAAYLRLLVPPVIAAYAENGVVFEPHLQNVLVAVDDDGLPVQVLLRDLEGTKLLPDHPDNAAFLGELPEAVAAPMTYDAQRGWDRVVYCLVVNHLAEMLAALADLQPELEARLWQEVRTVFAECGERHPDDPRLRALLAGVPLPAKANLFTRWERRADRDASYVRIASPLGADFLAGLGLTEAAV